MKYEKIVENSKDGEFDYYTQFMKSMDRLIIEVYSNADKHGFYEEAETTPKHSFLAERLCLIHSEVSEALESVRNSSQLAPCNKPVPINQMEEELADIIIRCMDLAGYMNLNLPRAIILKHVYNKQRIYKHGKVS